MHGSYELLLWWASQPFSIWTTLVNLDLTTMQSCLVLRGGASLNMVLIRTTNRVQLYVACWCLLSLPWQLCTNQCHLLRVILVNWGTVNCHCPAKAYTVTNTLARSNLLQMYSAHARANINHLMQSKLRLELLIELDHRNTFSRVQSFVKPSLVTCLDHKDIASWVCM